MEENLEDAMLLMIELYSELLSAATLNLLTQHMLDEHRMKIDKITKTLKK